MNLISVLIFTILLVVVNAFFVTAEFSLLRVRKTRLQKLFDSNAFGSDALHRIMKDLNVHIIASQIGITLTTLSVGFVTLPYFESLFNNWFDNTTILTVFAMLGALLAVSFFHSVMGEIIPKLIAIHHVEAIAMRIAPVLYYLAWAMRPLTWLYRHTAVLLLKLVRIEVSKEVYSRVYSEDELKILIAQSQESGEIDESEEILINRVLDFTDTRVNEIFTPRYEIVAFEINSPLETIIQKAKETGYSRFPVYEEKLDQVQGFVHLKDILVANHDDPDFSIRKIIRRVFIIHEAMRLDLLLRRMQQDRSQVAIVVDEYGSVEGLVTIEDILEAIVGPIDDEFDLGSVELVKKVNRNKYVVDGRVTLDVFNQAFQCNLQADDSVTIAGFILEHLEEVPKEGSKISFEGRLADFEFVVDKMDGNRVERANVFVKRKPIMETNQEVDEISS